MEQMVTRDLVENFVEEVKYDKVVELVDMLKEDDLRRLYFHVQELLSFDIVAMLQVNIAETIFSYLDPASLCAAGACSHYWRTIANTDTLWKRLCIGRNVAHLSYLPLPKFPAAPANSSPSHTSSTPTTTPRSPTRDGSIDVSDPRPSPITSPCHWKQVFIKSQQLLHNWKRGRYYLSPLLKGHGKPVTSIACDDSFIVSGSSDNCARVWSLQTLECRHVLEGHTDSVNDITCKNGLVVTACADGLVRVYDLHTGQYLWAMYGHRGSVDHVAFNGELAISGGSDCVVKIWDVKTGKELHSLSGHTDEIECLWLGETGMAVSGSWDHTMRIWDVKEGICKHVLLGHSEVVYCCMALSECVVSGGGDSQVKVWHLQSGHLIGSFLGHEQEVVCLQCSEIFIASASADSTIRLWNYNGKCLHVMEGHIGIVRCLCLKGDILVSAGDRKRINIWKVKDGKLLHTVYKQQTLVHRMCVTDTQIVTASPDSPGVISVINYW